MMGSAARFDPRPTAALLLLLGSLLLAVVAARADGQPAPGESLGAVFTTPDTRWTSETYHFAAPRYLDNELGKGYEFACDFAAGDPGYPRCFWDAKLPRPADLSGVASLALKVRLSNPEAVRFFCLYLRSNGKWHLSRYYEALGAGTNLVIFQLADYRVEGTSKPCPPASLNAVEELRVNIFPREGLQTPQTLATVTGLQASLTKLDSYAALPLFEPPAAEHDLPRAGRRDAQGRLLESRAIHDMGCRFLTEGAEAVLGRLKRAGFNVYLLTAWHGRGAIYRSQTTRVEPRFAAYFKGTADPTAEMIRKAHAAGLQVLGQFCVAYRGEPDPHPEFPVEGTPMEGGYLHCYDLQDPAYREFIAREIVDFVSRYEVDGLVLDYLRTVGISFSAAARASYEREYGPVPPGGPDLGGLAAVFTAAGTRWTSETYKLAAPRRVSEAAGEGYAFSCDFAAGDPAYPRCLWDATLATPLDLSQAGAIDFSVRFSNPAAVKAICLYLRSNGRWYLSKSCEVTGPGPQAVSLRLADYRAEGTTSPCRPEALGQVEAVRVNVFPRTGLQTEPTVATLTGVHVVRGRIDELKGPRTAEVEGRLLRWQEKAVSDLVSRISEGARAVRPGLVIVVDGHPLPRPQLQEQGRNEWLWLEHKWIDVAYDMDYGWRPNFAAYEAAANATPCPERFALLLGNYDEEGGKPFPRNPAQLARLVDYTLRKYPGRGLAIFDYGSLSDAQVEALRAGPFAEAAVPSWP